MIYLIPAKDGSSVADKPVMKTIIIISFIILQFGQQALAAEKKLSGRLQELGLRFVDHCPAADRAIIQAMNSECTQFLKGSLG